MVSYANNFENLSFSFSTGSTMTGSVGFPSFNDFLTAARDEDQLLDVFSASGADIDALDTWIEAKGGNYVEDLLINKVSFFMDQYIERAEIRMMTWLEDEPCPVDGYYDLVSELGFGDVPLVDVLGKMLAHSQSLLETELMTASSFDWIHNEDVYKPGEKVVKVSKERAEKKLVHLKKNDKKITAGDYGVDLPDGWVFCGFNTSTRGVWKDADGKAHKFDTIEAALEFADDQQVKPSITKTKSGVYQLRFPDKGVYPDDREAGSWMYIGEEGFADQANQAVVVKALNIRLNCPTMKSEQRIESCDQRGIVWDVILGQRCPV